MTRKFVAILVALKRLHLEFYSALVYS